MFDVIVIGGGPAGMMAAISAAKEGATTILLEKGHALGRKLSITGGGRCNVTSNLSVEDIIKNIPGNGKFLYSAFSIFNNQDIITFFNKSGVKLKEEDNGRMFPEDDQSSTIINAFIKNLKKNKVTISCNSPVKSLIIKDATIKGVLLESGEKIYSKAIIIAVGGKSIPTTGSTGDGYTWAKDVGHTITPLYPTESPLVSQEKFIIDRTLQGLSLQGIELSVVNPKGKKIVSHRHDLIFTHFGVSGPAALRCSQFIRQVKEKFKIGHVTLELDCLPKMTKEELLSELLRFHKEEPKKSFKNILKQFIPERLAEFFLNNLGIDLQSQLINVKKDTLINITNLIKGFSFTVTDTLGFDKAFVTGGGVSTKEINPKEMSSKIVDGLYFCGEVLDIHAYTGGFNITAAIITGKIAGTSAGKTR
ncbi:MAG: NAD(FAD)-utilizing dehydrogenase [Bacillales bacterium]|jgi:predicted Rossmann fold flavoprotein|nr:NAD(FAD)-utilizing dehydrogenase [Bacillales bacterium]